MSLDEGVTAMGVSLVENAGGYKPKRERFLCQTDHGEATIPS